MGNSSSASSYEINDDNPVCQSGLWTLFTGVDKETGSKISVFQANLKTYGQLSNDLHRGIETLKRLRHPGVLRYLHSEIKGDSVNLFVEPVQPLDLLIEKTLSELEVCSGLHNILQAIEFLHVKANIVHNNISRNNIFVAEDGQWKLGCFDLSCSALEMSQGFLDQIRSHRYDKAVPPEDEGGLKFQKENVMSRDLFAYGQLVKETISCCVDSDIPFAQDFLDIANKQLQSSNPTLRGTATDLCSHKFFQQDLLKVEDFFRNIALKTPAETDAFYQALPEVLRELPEDVVGAKLSAMLLGRMVVLNPIAQAYLLPYLLAPRISDSGDCLEIFSLENYRRYILPKISRIFFVRDLQVRLVLLKYFATYFRLFDATFLREELLPEILLGIRDTSDELVAATLHVLSELVLMFGAEVVIGGKRLKLFADGKPKFTQSSTAGCEATEKAVSLKTTPVQVAKVLPVEDAPLPERHAPDGGEDNEDLIVHDEDQGAFSSDAAADWSDWEATDQPQSVIEEPVQVEVPVVKRNVKAEPFDLSALEIQVKPKEDDFDFFADMQPTIVPQTETSAAVPAPVVEQSKFSFSAAAEADDEDADGWNWDD